MACKLSPVPYVWFLLNFPVCRADKTTTKTSIAFDASAKYDGVSLNDMILPGLKQESNLFDVLLQIRRFSLAIVDDI